MIEAQSRPSGRRWSRRVAPVGLAAPFAAGPATQPASAATEPPPPTPVQTNLPAPTGHHEVGTVSLHLVDPGRTDPLVPDHPVREYMVQLWYPATDADRFPVAPYEPLQPPEPDPVVLPPATVAHTGAPLDRRHGPLPVVLYGPGAGSGRAIGTGLVEDLATHGYLVVTMDPTHDAPAVAFPGGRVEPAVPSPPDTDIEALKAFTRQLLVPRVGDTLHTLDQLAVLNNGGDPDAEHAVLPKGLRGGIDLSRIGMFGWSLGGDTAAEVMATDPRIRAGADLDGSFFGPAAETGVTRPFLLMSNSTHGRDNDATWASFWAHTTGPKVDLRLADSAHGTFTDNVEIVRQAASVLGLTPQQVAEDFGTIDPTSAVTDQRVYLRAFFDRYLRDRDETVLNGPSWRFPDITSVP